MANSTNDNGADQGTDRVPPEDDAENTREPEPSLAHAIAALADALGGKQGAQEKPQRLKFIKSLVESVLPSLVMFALGYIFIQGVELDLKREEFTAGTADKLKSYVETIMTATPNNTEEKDKLKAIGLALGGFGGIAAYPLVSIIESGNEQVVAAAKSGLEQAARIGPDVTCDILAAVIDDATGAYEWKTQKTVSEVAGLAGCIATGQSLERLKENIRDIPGLSPTQIDNFEKTVENALSRVDAASSRKGKW